MSKRKFWQFHLSTAVLLMLVAGGLMFQNKIPHRLNCFSHDHPELPDVFGWPFPVIWGDGDVWLREESRQIPWSLKAPLLGVALDFGFALLVLAALAASCEHLIRRREARKR